MIHAIKVIGDAAGEVVKVIFANSKREAEKIENGLLINLNYNEFTVEIEEVI